MQNIILIFFLFLRIISNPIANVFQKKLSLSVSSAVINFYTYLLLSIFCLFRLNILKGFVFSPEFIILTLVCGLLCTTGMICMIKAVNIGELSVLGPINSYKSIISLLIAFFLLKEIPSYIGLLGIFLIVFGSKYIFCDKNTQFTLNLLKREDLQFRFLAMTLTAIEAVLLKKIILISSVEICFIFWCFTGLFWSFIVIMQLKRVPVINNKEMLYSLFIIASCLGLMQFSTNYVFEKMNVGYALSLFQLSSIVTVILGCKFFKEKNILSKLIGSMIMIIGSCLIIAG